MKTLHVRVPQNPEYFYAQHAYAATACKIFLAGSIEMGKCLDWQSEFVERFPNDVLFLNPRIEHWDSTWEQDINSAPFYRQVSWELDMLDASDIIFIYFDPTTRSPISLLELGLYAASNKLIVCCPNGYWRKGNVDIVCQRYGIPVFTSMDAAEIAVRNKINKFKYRR